MNYCASSYDLVLVVEVALGIFHEDLKVGSQEHIHTQEQEDIEDFIISTLT